MLLAQQHAGHSSCLFARSVAFCSSTFSLLPAALQGLLAAVWAAERKLHPLRSMFTAAPTPQLTFSAGPLPAQPAPLLPYK